VDQDHPAALFFSVKNSMTRYIGVKLLLENIFDLFFRTRTSYFERARRKLKELAVLIEPEELGPKFFLELKGFHFICNKKIFKKSSPISIFEIKF